MTDKNKTRIDATYHTLSTDNHIDPNQSDSNLTHAVPLRGTVKVVA